MCKQMMDLFYLVGEKAIHATIIRMLELSKNDILEIKDPEKLQNFVKKDIYQLYYAAFEKDKHEATCLEHFGLCFFEEIEHLEFEGNMDSTE